MVLPASSFAGAVAPIPKARLLVWNSADKINQRAYPKSSSTRRYSSPRVPGLAAGN